MPFLVFPLSGLNLLSRSDAVVVYDDPSEKASGVSLYDFRSLQDDDDFRFSQGYNDYNDYDDYDSYGDY